MGSMDDLRHIRLRAALDRLKEPAMDTAAQAIAILNTMSPEAQQRALQFLTDMRDYEQHRMDDGNMPHDVGMYCECPECSAGEMEDWQSYGHHEPERGPFFQF